MKRISKNCF